MLAKMYEVKEVVSKASLTVKWCDGQDDEAGLDQSSEKLHLRTLPSRWQECCLKPVHRDHSPKVVWMDESGHAGSPWPSFRDDQ